MLAFANVLLVCHASCEIPMQEAAFKLAALHADTGITILPATGSRRPLSASPGRDSSIQWPSLRDSGKVVVLSEQSLRRSTTRQVPADIPATVPVALESYKERLHSRINSNTNNGSYTKDSGYNTTKGYDRTDNYDKNKVVDHTEPAPAEEACLLANTLTERLINATGNNDTM